MPAILGTQPFLHFPSKLFFMNLTETLVVHHINNHPDAPPRESALHGILSKMSLLAFLPCSYDNSSVVLRSYLLDSALSLQGGPPTLTEMW